MTGDIRKQLGEALDEAEVDVKDMGHVWRFGDQICGEAALRLIERDRALIERHHPESGYDRPPCVGCHANFVEDWYGTVEECPELLAAAAFWLGSSEVTDGR